MLFSTILSLVLIAVEPFPYSDVCRSAVSTVAPQPPKRGVDQLIAGMLSQLKGEYGQVVKGISSNSMQNLESYMKASKAFILPTPSETLNAFGLDVENEAHRLLATRFIADLGEILLEPDGYEKLFAAIRESLGTEEFSRDQFTGLKVFSKYLIRRGLPLGEGNPFLSAQILISPEAETLRKDSGLTNVPIWGRAQSLKARLNRATSSFALTDFALRIHVLYMRGKNSKLFTSIVDAEKATEFNKAIKKVLEDDTVRGYLPSKPADYQLKGGRYFKTFSRLARAPSDELFKTMYPDLNYDLALSDEAVEAWNLLKDKEWNEEFFSALAQMANRTLDSISKLSSSDELKALKGDLSKVNRSQAIEILKYVIPRRDLAAYLEAMDLAYTEHRLTHANALKPIDDAFEKMNKNFNAYEVVQNQIAKYEKELREERDPNRRLLLAQLIKQQKGARTLTAKQFVEAYRESYVYSQLLKHGLEPRYTHLIETDPIMIHENHLYEHRITDEYNSLEIEKMRQNAEAGIVETGSTLARAATIFSSTSSTDPMAHLMRAVGEANAVATRLSKAGFIRRSRFASLIYTGLAVVLPTLAISLPPYAAYMKYRDTTTIIPTMVRDGKYLTDEVEFNKVLTDIKLRAMHGQLTHFEVRDLERLLEAIDPFMLTPEGVRVLEDLKSNQLYASLASGGKYWASAAEDIEQQVDFIIRTHYMLNCALTADWKKQQSKIYVDYEAYKKSIQEESDTSGSDTAPSASEAP